jgi:hypothetical protein
LLSEKPANTVVGQLAQGLLNIGQHTSGDIRYKSKKTTEEEVMKYLGIVMTIIGIVGIGKALAGAALLGQLVSSQASWVSEAWC